MGGVFYVGSKMNSFGILCGGGVFYIGSKMNSFGILWGGGVNFFSTHAFHIHTHAIQIRLVALCVSRSATKN